MKKILLAGAAVVALSLSAMGAAEAGLLQITGGDAYTTPANNDFSSPWEGRVNATTAMTVSTTAANVTLTYEFLFKEAGFVNTFTTSFGSFLNTAAIGTSVGGLQAAIDALIFSFTTPSEPGNPLNNGDVAKLVGSGPDNYSFFATTNAPGGIAGVASGAMGNVVWLAFDDSGAQTDDNHDDMIIRVTATVVPEPASIALFGAGLLGLGLARRVRRRTA